MYEMAKKAREAMKGKAKRLSGEKDQKVDSSNWTPSDPLDADVKTGMRPISPRAYKKGGKVMGEAAECHAGRKPRKSGGRAITADSLINRDQKEANEGREGKKHIGGMKKGGRAGKAMGGMPTAGLHGSTDPAALIKAVTGPTMGFKKGGRSGKAMGGQLDPRMAAMAAPAGRGAPMPMPVGRGAPMPINPRMLAMMKAKAAMAQGSGNTPPMKKGGRTGKQAGGGMSAADEARAAAAAAAAARQRAEDARTQGEREDPRNQKRGGRTNRKDGGNVNFGPMEMPAGKKGMSTSEQEALERKQDAASKPTRGKSKNYADGGLAPYGATAPVPMNGPANPVAKNALNFGMGASGSPYKKGGMAKWEGSAKDEAQDKKLAKKHGMSMKAWEASKMDTKHDKQESMKGLKRGGEAKKWISEAIGKPGALHKSLGVPAGEKIPAKKLEKAEASKNPKLAKRAHLAETLKHISRANKFGGGALSDGPKKGGKGKTNINILINPGAKPDAMGGAPGMPPMPPRPVGGIPVPMGMPPAGGAPPMGMPMPMPLAPAPGGMPPMGRKAGGKVYKSYKDMDAGAGSGLGRLEKTEIQKRKA
jgi:hypothetical protein